MGTRIRRARRSDYMALAPLVRLPFADGRSVRLFRKVVADLGCDPYVLEDEAGLAGFVSVSYARVLALGGKRATVEELAVRPGVSPAALLEHALMRASRRGARELRVLDGLVERTMLEGAGFAREPGAWGLALGGS